MAKRQADETATNDVVALSQTAASHTLYTKNIHAEIHQNATKKLHLSPTDEREDAPTNRCIDKQSIVISSTDEQSLRSLDAPLDKLRQVPSDLDIQNKIHGTNQIDEAQDASKHLVKTISDLPVFVTIEGYRVASYMIDGEPHLCLPQLLKFIQKIFPLDRVIDKFEESMTNFVPATPKQVEGFIKAIVLPQDATACPLIKRSDAERICLALYDQNPKERVGDLVDSKVASTSKDNLEPARKDSQTSSPQGNIATKDLVHDVGELSSEKEAPNSSKDSLSEQSFPSHSGKNSQISANDNGEQNETPQQTFETKPRKLGVNATPSPPLPEIPEGRESASPGKKSKVLNVPSTFDRSANIENKERFFETEAQDSILNLARSVTSTLMIQVYHRCFGKCVGLYYPSLLNNSESNCIECSSCHKMLSPRRFIGHTHGVKEVNVCHWGFNSYHWRNYIRLSRKQSMNNLDDDELLVQFNLLKSLKDEGIDMTKDFHQSLSEKEMKSEKYVNEVAHNLDLAKRHASQAYPSTAQNSQESIMKDLPRDLSAKASTNRTASAEHSKFMPASNEQSPFHAIGSSAINLSSLNKIPSAWNIERLTGTFSRKTSLPVRIPVASHTRGALKSSSANHLSGSIVSPQPSTSSDYQSSSSSFMLDSINKTHANLELLKLYGDANNAHLATSKFSSAFPQLAAESLIKQDLFVSTSLSNYLNARGIPSQMIQEIVSTTLSLIHKARISY